MNRFKDLVQEEIANIRELLVYYEATKYPGKDVLIEGKKVFDEVVSKKDTMEFYEKVYELKDDFLDYIDYCEDVQKFFENQKKFFDDALKKIGIYNKNKTYVLDQEAIELIGKINSIVTSKEPYSQVPQLPSLIEGFSNRFTDLLEVECAPVRNIIESDCEKVLNDLHLYEFEDELSGKFKKRFNELIQRLDNANNFYEAVAMKEESDRLKMRCFDEISKEIERRRPVVHKKVDGGTDLGDGTAGVGGRTHQIYRNRKTKTVSIANILRGAKTIENKEDIEGLLDDIRKKLNEELVENTMIKLV